MSSGAGTGAGAGTGDAVFDIRGGRGALTAEKAIELVAGIDSGDTVEYTKAILSTWAFDEESAKIIAAGLAKLEKLVDVDMSDIIAGREEAIGLAVYRALSAVLKDKPLRSLNLSDNALGPKGVEACLEMLQNQENLEELFLCRNGVSAEALRTLAGLLMFRTPTKLTTLHLFNNMCGGEGAKAAADIIAASPGLKDFRFSSCRGTADGGLALARALKATTSLEKLELSDNMFDEELGTELAVVLPQQTGLKHLDVSDIGLADDGVTAICEAISGHCTQLEHLSFAANDVTDEAGDAICKLVQASPELRVFSMEDNDEFTSEGWEAVIDALVACEKLEKVVVSGTTIGATAFRRLLAAVHAKPGFTALVAENVALRPSVVAADTRGIVQNFEGESDAEDDGADAEGDAAVDDVAAALEGAAL